MGQLILVRHGKTQFNIDKKFTGFTDVDISEQGVSDAKVVAEKLAALQIQPTKVYTSWLKRAWQTLDIIQTESGWSLPVTKHPFLNERHYGDLQGKTHEEMISLVGAEQVHTWRRSYDVRPPNGESLADVVGRVSLYYQSEILPQLQRGETVLVCAHGNANRALVKILENISNEDIVHREIAYDEPLVYSV